MYHPAFARSCPPELGSLNRIPLAFAPFIRFRSEHTELSAKNIAISLPQLVASVAALPLSPECLSARVTGIAESRPLGLVTNPAHEGNKLAGRSGRDLQAQQDQT